MPSVELNAHRIPIPIVAKALAWQKNRSRNTKDRYFDEFVEEFLHGMEKEMPKCTDSEQRPNVPAENHDTNKITRRLEVSLLFPFRHSNDISPHCQITLGAHC